MEALHYDFMQRALLAGGLVGLVCSVVGVFVVLRGLAFIGAGISHSALAGVAIGLLLGISPLFASLVFCSLVALSLGAVSRLGRIKEDTAIGIFFAATMALGVLLMSLAQSNTVDLVAYLFGSILTVSYTELMYSAALVGGVLAGVILLYKELVSVIFDEELAEISGIPARSVAYFLLILISVAVVASIKLVGIVLVSALIVTPAATALQFSRDFHRAIVLAGIIGVIETEAGLILSFYLDCPPGATIVLLSTVVFIAAAFLARRNT